MSDDEAGGGLGAGVTVALLPVMVVFGPVPLYNEGNDSCMSEQS
jgi:hypothetical protein